MLLTTISYWRIYLLSILCISLVAGSVAQERQEEQDTMAWQDHTSGDWGNFTLDSSGTNAAAVKVNVPARQVSYTEQFLQGSMAGVVAIENSGQPGGSMSLQIRGMQSAFASGEPLYVIDGIPIYQNIDASAFSTTFGPPLGVLSFLNPNDISSITVLKDATATSLYGARGSNGVLVIRTKRAKESGAEIEVNLWGGLQEPIGEHHLANAQQFATFLNQSHTNAGLPNLYANPDLFGVGTDWQQSIRRDKAWSQNYHIGISGGSEKVSFRLGGQYFRQDGIMIGSDLQRYSLRANIDAQINDRFIIQNSFNFVRVDANTIPSASSADLLGQDAISGTLLFNPLLPLINTDQSVNNHNVRVGSDGRPQTQLQSHFAQANPQLLAGITDSRLSHNQLSEFLNLDYAFTEKLRLRSAIGLNAIFNDQFTFVPGQLFFGPSADAVGTGAKTQSLQFINEHHISYTHHFTSTHQIDARLGFSVEGFRQEFLAGQSVGFDNESLRFYSLTVGKNKNLQSDLTEWGMQSYLGRVQYIFKDKYSLAFSLRSDASSIFGGKHSIFPAVSSHWDLSNEPFLVKSNLIDQLNLRVSFGMTGNQAIAPYSSYTLLNEFNPALNGGIINGISLSRIGNDNLEVEKTKQFNAGLQVGFLDGHFLLDFDVYHHKTDNGLVWQPLAGTSGFRGVPANAATIVNKGAELSLSANYGFAPFKWRGQFSLAYNKNEVESLADNDFMVQGDQILGITDWSLLQAGSPIGSFYGYQADGLVRDGENPASFGGQVLSPGDQKYRDLNGDGVINAADKTIIGQAQPTISLGIFNKFTFKNFDLGIFFQGLWGHDIANFNRLLLENPTGSSNVSVDYLEQAGKSLPLPRRVSNAGFVFSDRIIEDGSYLRLKNVTIGYTVPNLDILSKSVSSLRIYLAAENLLTFSGYSGLDPDVHHFGPHASSPGVDLGIYPKAKLFMAGININF